VVRPLIVKTAATRRRARGHAGRAESWSGSLEPGKVADFVVLSGDPTAQTAAQIAQLNAEQVFIAGKQIR